MQTTGRSRKTDPSTSHEAGAKVELRASQARVLAMFNLYGDMHDKQLLDRLHDAERQAGFTKLMSPSGVRTRRSELSKPNMDRLAEIVRELTGVAVHQHDLLSADQSDEAVLAKAREHLRREGFRSKLWDTGARQVVDGRSMVIWGVAR